MSISELQRQLNLISRGTVEIIQLDELKEKTIGIDQRTSSSENKGRLRSNRA